MTPMSSVIGNILSYYEYLKYIHHLEQAKYVHGDLSYSQCSHITFNTPWEQPWQHLRINKHLVHSVYRFPFLIYFLLLGHYIYIETSAPVVTGHVARLKSPVLFSTKETPRCLIFWYHMWVFHFNSICLDGETGYSQFFIARDSPLDSDIHVRCYRCKRNQSSPGGIVRPPYTE